MAGLNAKQSGLTLGLSHRTVEDHLARIKQKLGFKTSATHGASFLGREEAILVREGAAPPAPSAADCPLAKRSRPSHICHMENRHAIRVRNLVVAVWVAFFVPLASIWILIADQHRWLDAHPALAIAVATSFSMRAANAN